MRDMMWIYAVIIFLVSEAWSLQPGTNQGTSVNSSTTNELKANVTRYLEFNLGSDANLNCSDKTWNETIYVIWTIKSNNKSCKISISDKGGDSMDSCNDGKSLRNTSRSQSYLHIPNFSVKDVGIYTCEQTFKAGLEAYGTNVTIIVPPNISAWLEQGENKMVAVCKAEGKPAANISWSHEGNSTTVETHLAFGFITVESRLELAEGMDTKNLTCAIRHRFWKEPKILILNPTEGHFLWLLILIVVVVAISVLGFSFFAHKKLPLLRPCQQPATSPSKSPTIEDVEEVEPYASYHQRVNSIYN
ncbi:cell surface glycoprotein CD200 receptor 1 isoform X1 [Seriola aureovittata]|uniref:cell surface glycoprotein CD200 receptor 1 isoform X1 n=1 Tax=Seriola aureovittata TaxID=2871759 RepID=UPI0024BE2ED2|nr:cell surface glycoprotein CD200 receptor 1 isoform X1 [Seriola aureovittata]